MKLFELESLVAKAYAKLSRATEDDELTLRELLEIGLNQLIDYETNDCMGYEVESFDDELLDRRVILHDYLTDSDGFTIGIVSYRKEGIKI